MKYRVKIETNKIGQSKVFAQYNSGNWLFDNWIGISDIGIASRYYNSLSECFSKEEAHRRIALHSQMKKNNEQDKIPKVKYEYVTPNKN